MKKDYFVIFVAKHLYYIPQFLPIAKELQKRGRSLMFLMSGKDLPEQNKMASDFCKKHNFDCFFYADFKTPAKCKFMVNGGNSFPETEIDYQYSVSVIHGIGTKKGYYTEKIMAHDIRFIEGQTRVDKLNELFPNSKCQLFNVGFSKLDTALSYTSAEKEQLIKHFKLDTTKKTILYAPTFYPSSIEKMPKKFPADFQEFNIIVKPHFFTFQKKKYSHQVRKFNKWEKHSNVYFARADEFDLSPFFAIADILLSDESSAVFEFAALNKPVVINRNIHHRLTYRLFKQKRAKRMDSFMEQYRKVGVSIYKYNELKNAIVSELKADCINNTERQAICDSIVGTADGKVAIRMVDILENFK